MAGLTKSAALNPLLVAASTLASLVLLSFVTKSRQKAQKIVPSPRETLLPFLSDAEAAELPYHPNHIPGGRDVDTPYGVMRVYEWGPEHGRKVMMLHGDSVSTPVLSPIAHALVSKGCRVIMFDLWGRGYSDSPLDVPHDARLFSMQIFFAATSSFLPWLDGFSIVAFSLGGGIAMSFAAHFPCSVNSLVLLAPVGILRRLPNDYVSYLVRYSKYMPYALLEEHVRKMQGVGTSKTTADRTASDPSTAKSYDSMKAADIMFKERFDTSAIVEWQFRNHKGFVHSFTDTINNGPIMHQHSDWQKVCNILSGNKHQVPASQQRSKLFDSKLLVIAGESDGVVSGNEILSDLSKMMPDSSHLEFNYVPGGHGFLSTSSDETVEHILGFWKL